MRRGFKSEAERLASELRKDVECEADDPIPLELVAQQLGVELIPGDDILPIDRFETLDRLQPDAFSAGTFRLPKSGRKVVVHNPLHGEGRTRSNQAHELAHLLLDHSLRTVERIGSFRFLTCNAEQEEEADWLGGCLLLPRAILLAAARDNQTPAQIAEAYLTSEPMARFRLNASGVLVQVGRERARRRQ